MNHLEALQRALQRVAHNDFLDGADTIPDRLLEDIANVELVPEAELDSGPAVGWNRPLTERELEVVKWMSVGLTHQETADVMCLSLETVKSHSKHARRAARAKTSPHLVAIAIREGWIG